MLKMSCIPTIAGLQFLMYGVTLSKRTLAALSFILLGVFVAIANDDNSSQTLSHTTHNPHNTAFQSVLAYVTHLPVLVSLSTILTTSLSQILLNRSPDLKRMSSLQIISAISFTSFLVCATSAVAVDVGVSLLDWIRLILSFVGSNPLISAFIPQSYEALLFSGQDIDQARQTPAGGQDNLEFLDGMSSRAYLVEHILGKFISFFNKITQASGHSNGAGVLGWVFVSCLLSVLTNLLGFAVIKRTSAITFQVIGHFKTVATLAIGSILFGYEGFLGLKGVGLAVALLGMMLYSQK
ncbi:hypothetical protein HDU83_000740 [Entophlyctis luteolus]|nr:hypothetical protein HDU83_000740 [Entophlyctis luteolus]